jgi:hypothetical protein
MKRTTRRRLTLAFTAVAVLVWGLAIVGMVAPCAACFGHTGLAISGPTLELARGSVPIAKQGRAWKVPPKGGGSVLLWPQSSWLPSTTHATMSIAGSGGPTVTMTLRVYFVPLIPWAILFSAAAAFMRWLTPRAIPVHCCQTCGYDLVGTPAGPCPECGKPRAWSIVRLLFDRAARGRPVSA